MTALETQLLCSTEMNSLDIMVHCHKNHIVQQKLIMKKYIYFINKVVNQKGYDVHIG